MNTRIASYFFFILLLVAFVAAIFIFLPFLSPIVLGAAGAVLAYPLYRTFLRIFGRGQIRSNLAAFLTVVIILLLVLTPLFFIVARIYVEVQSLYVILTDESQRSQIIDSLNSLSQGISSYLFNIFPAYSFDSLNVTAYLKSMIEWAFSHLDSIFTGFASVLAYVFVFLLSVFYFLRDGEIIKRRFVSWSPLLDEYDEYITRTLERAIHSVFAGTVIVSIIQGILTGFGFFLFGIPAPAVWGTVASVAAFIPGIGTSLVIVPGIIYLLIVEKFAFAIGLAIWGALAVGLIDNLLGPYLVNKGINIHPFLILISVLGGIVTFGPIGFVMGPLILSVLFALLDIYRVSYTKS